MSAYALPGPGLVKNPVLPAARGGQDSQYAAGEAQLRADILRRYQDILQQIGYKDESGNYIPGEVETQAKRQEAELTRNQGLAEEEVNKQAQREGTLFSGLRSQNIARAQHPFVQGLADLAADVPKQLQQLYQQGTRTLEDYTIQNNLLLADAAARGAARAAAAAGYGGGGYSGSSGSLAGGGSPDDIAAALAGGYSPVNNPVLVAPSGNPPTYWTPSYRSPEGYNFKTSQLERMG